MTEQAEQSFGGTALNEKHGLKPLKISTSEVAASDSGITVSEARESIRNRAKQESPAIETRFEDGTPDGPILTFDDKGTGKAVFDSPEEAAESLKAGREKYREDHQTKERANDDKEFAKQIDRIRGEPSQPQLEQTAKDAETRKADQVREHREMMEKVARDYQAQEAQKQRQVLNSQHEQLRATGLAVISHLAAEFPEVANLQPNQMWGAVAALQARGNPERAQALASRLKAADNLYQESTRLKAATARHESTTHANYVREQAAAFDRGIAKDPPARRQAVYQGVEDLLKSSGIDPVAFVNVARQGGELGRLLASNAVQTLLYKAAAAQVDVKSRSNVAADIIKKVAPPDLPQVTRPGARQPRAPAGAALQSQLGARLNNAKGDNALRIAAQMLSSKRKSR